MNVKTILLPVDGSAHSDKAADYAVGMAKTLRASIVLLQCRKPVPNELGEPNLQWVLDHYTKDSEEIIEPYRKQIEAEGIPCKDMVIGGRPAEVIDDVARSEKADIIIMGSKGKSDFEGFMLGSVTHKVLHIAPCPVLVVK
ncbi:universal stress protein [Salidesulfovibrio onnuriiensis]|uniref:universal stress protein n=1 Tax=Salidesulfovibrio onnuriiensis TaxID=2583823 RepID=UPI0011CC3501|nr:universal stress protein [Salidesulfovibrio onnuriiensis]